MADPGEPRLKAATQATSEGLGVAAGRQHAKESQESLVSRSDSASGEEAEEQPPPGSVLGKTGETSRKGRRISACEALKV